MTGAFLPGVPFRNDVISERRTGSTEATEWCIGSTELFEWCSGSTEPVECVRLAAAVGASAGPFPKK